jgi:hypothetical protein
MVVIEAYPSFCLIPWLWDYHVAILVVVIIIASVGSHMPGRQGERTLFPRDY